MKYNIDKIYKNYRNHEEYDEYWYRFEEVRNPGKYDFPTIFRRDFGVVRHTPKGVILDIGYKTRFAQQNLIKRFASPDEKQAMKDFWHRKLAQRKILRDTLDHTERAVTMAEKLLIDNGIR